MKKFDYQIVTSENKWEGGGVQETQKEIDKTVAHIKARLSQEGRDEEIIVFKSEKMKQYTVK